MRELGQGTAKVHKLLPTILAPMLAMVGNSAMVAPSGGKAAPEGPLFSDARLGQPPPLLIRPISVAAALDLNRAIPFDRYFNFPARGFQFKGNKEALDRALECLTSAIYYEAGSEDPKGRQAVAQVILNRVRHPAFPASICAVVFQGSTRETGCQFTFTCDGSLMRRPNASGWAGARKIANDALAGAVSTGVGLATHYHADYVVPYWATSLAKNSQLGSHIFYRWPNGEGKPDAFHQEYSPLERDLEELRVAALMADHLWPARPVSSFEQVVELAADPTVELLGIVAMLAQPTKVRGNGFARDIASYFAGQADHVAVQLFKEAQGGVPASIQNAPVIAAESALPWRRMSQQAQQPVATADTAMDSARFIASLGDFANKSNFEGFFRKHRNLYTEASVEASRAFAEAAGDWQIYTGLPVQDRKVVLALALAENAAGCLPSEIKLPEDVLLWSPPLYRSSHSSLFVDSGIAQHMFDGRKGKMIPGAIQESIVRAVIQRINALSGGPAANRSAGKAASNDELHSVFATRLRLYERQRDRYETLSDFLPTLLAGVKLTGDATGAKASDQTRLQRCEVRPMAVS